jgi:hypothetical protein
VTAVTNNPYGVSQEMLATGNQSDLERYFFSTKHDGLLVTAVTKNLYGVGAIGDVSESCG